MPTGLLLPLPLAAMAPCNLLLLQHQLQLLHQLQRLSRQSLLQLQHQLLLQ